MPDLFERLKQALAGRYRLQEPIGQGGMAVVYLAEDLKHRRLVALKVLRPELALAPDRFLREIEIVARLTHPHIVPLLDSGDVEGIPYYVMPYLPGESLRGRLQREPELPAGEAVRILRDVVEALAYAHGQGLIHRDIKPENVLLAGRNAMVTDFGIARAVREAIAGPRLTTVGVALGTPDYMAPEQAAGEGDVDHRADLYAVGVLGYEMLSGAPPFGGRRAGEILAAQVAKPVPPLALRRTLVPPALVATIMRCLEKRPEDRWQSADDLLGQLEALLTPSSGTTPAGRGPVPATRAQLRRWRFAAIASGVLILAIGAELMLGGREVPLVSPVERQLTFAGNADTPRLSPDGQFFAYRMYEEDRERLMVQQVSGGPALEVGSFARLGALPQWSRDGSQLLYSSVLPGRTDHVGVLVSRLGGAAQPVPVPPGGLGAWLPERSLLAMGRGGELELMNLGTGEVSRRIPIPSARALTNRLAWAPRGDMIAVVSADSGGFALRNMSVNGDRQFTLVERQPQLYTPQWSDDGLTLYFAREERDGQSVWRVRLWNDGSPRGEPELVLPGLTGLPARRLINAGLTPFTISSDGTRLVHARVATGSNLWLIRLDSPGTKVPITTGTSLKRHPSVSPDGKDVIFAVRESGRMGAFRTSLSGGSPHRIGALHDSVGRPVWSSAGDRVAYLARDGDRTTLRVFGAEGTPGRVIPISDAGDLAELAWAPGPSLLYQHVTRKNFVEIDPETGAGTMVAKDTLDSRIYDVQSTADGARLALWHTALQSLAVWTRGDAAPTLVYRASHRVGGALPLGWSADERRIYFNDMRDIYFISSAGGEPRKVVTLPVSSEQVLAVAMVPGGRAFVVAVEERRSDVWMIENFDPRRPRRSPKQGGME